VLCCSYSDFLHQVLQNNTTVLFAGFTLIIVYVVVMLGRFNLVEQRVSVYQICSLSYEIEQIVVLSTVLYVHVKFNDFFIL
jgi:hypothetical protein